MPLHSSRENFRPQARIPRVHRRDRIPIHVSKEAANEDNDHDRDSHPNGPFHEP